MCDAVGGRVVAGLALVVEGRMLLLLVVLLLVVVVVLRRRAVGMDIHDAGTGVRSLARRHELVGVVKWGCFRNGGARPAQLVWGAVVESRLERWLSAAVW